MHAAVRSTRSCLVNHRWIAALVAALTVCAPAYADRRLRVSGPSTVTVGREVRFAVTGFKPDEKITVNLAPTINRGGNCCGVDVVRSARADAGGKAILHWRWPSYYLNGNDRVKWRNGSKVDVIVLTPAFARGLKVVRVYR